MPSPPNLSADFVWGVSTASYQIEGAVQEDGRGASIWDTYCRQIGRIANGDNGDVACDHYHRYAEDIDLMRALGIDAYRFSVAWPRILPAGRGAVNEAGLAFYERLIDAVLAAGIEPWLCLYHWDLPQALDDHGGWVNRDCALWFADYVAVVGRRFSDRVKRFATLNEPSVFTLFGYAFGKHAPGVADRAAHLRAVHHVNLAHGAAVEVLRSMVPAASIGAIHNYQPCYAWPDTPQNAAATELIDAYWNRAFPDPQLLASYPPPIADAIEPYQQAGDMAAICRRVDWFGLNHYSPIYCKADPNAQLGFSFSDAPTHFGRTGIGWPIHPDAFRESLMAIAGRYRLPIYVLENGYGGPEQANASGQFTDLPRIEYLSAYTQAMRVAIAAGVDVRGYFVWSLLDNFEWAEGYLQRFGLVHVDYLSQQRTPKASAGWYAKMIAASRHDVGTGAAQPAER
jgi:beta-glucosidase